MHEVVHLSLGPQANEINSSFYNKQTEYFVYSKEEVAKSHIDPNVRFVYGKEYTPRALFWEYRNGFGKWHQYNENYEAPQTEDAIANEQQLPITKQAISSETHLANQSSWTSRLKVPIHPNTMFTIPDWEIDYKDAPFGRQRGAPEGQKREFDIIEEGQEQFKVSKASTLGGSSEDYTDSTIRPMLEKCDLLDGINLVTDLGGWAGFTTSILEVMRDEYVPRLPIFTWCVSRNYSGKIRWPVQVSRIHALTSFAEFSSLVLPLQDNLKEADFTANANAHLRHFESTCLLSSLRRGRVSMHDLCQDLTTDIPAANMVQVGEQRLREFGAPAKKVKNTVEIWRGDVTPPVEGPESSPPPDVIGRSQNFKRYWYAQPDNFQMALRTEDSPIQLRKLVARARHDLREQVYDLTEPYIWGWAEDSSEDEYA